MKLRPRFLCQERFVEMRPVPGGRHCERCEKTVHDLSALTKKEAQALLLGAREEGRGICARVRLDERGLPLFRRPPPPRWAGPGGWLMAAAAALASGCEGIDYVDPSAATAALADPGFDGDAGVEAEADPGSEVEEIMIADPDWAFGGGRPRGAEEGPEAAGQEGQGAEGQGAEGQGAESEQGEEEQGEGDPPRVIELEMLGDIAWDPEEPERIDHSGLPAPTSEEEASQN